MMSDTGKFPKMKKAARISLNKEINGKVLLFISIYVMLTAIFEVGTMFFPSTLHPFVAFVIKIVVGTIIYVGCLLFNIDNPSLGKVFRDITEFLMDETIDDSTFKEKVKIYLAALNQKFMQWFDRQGEKISEGVIKVDSEPTKVEIIKKKVEESKTGTVILDGHGNPI